VPYLFLIDLDQWRRANLSSLAVSSSQRLMAAIFTQIPEDVVRTDANLDRKATVRRSHSEWLCRWPWGMAKRFSKGDGVTI
jgi:hypothetical protein